MQLAKDNLSLTNVEGIPILYRDEHLLALDKPSGLLSVPGRGEEKRDSVAYRAQQMFPSASVVHRLDWETSGVMLMPLNLETHRSLSRQFEERRVAKKYVAIVAGLLANDAGEINLPLVKAFSIPPEHKVCHEFGREAITHYQVAERLADRTRVDLFPKTGRSHQLRVHLAAIGHAILGDEIYASPEVQALSPRLLLHAAEIELLHPHTGRPLKITSPIPF